MPTNTQVTHAVEISNCSNGYTDQGGDYRTYPRDHEKHEYINTLRVKIVSPPEGLQPPATLSADEVDAMRKDREASGRKLKIAEGVTYRLSSTTPMEERKSDVDGSIMPACLMCFYKPEQKPYLMTFTTSK